MLKFALWSVSTLFATLLAGPVAFVSSQAGRPDPSDLYLLVAVGEAKVAKDALVSAGARPIGPERGLFGQLILAQPAAHARLQTIGYILLPAGAAAALCGFDAPAVLTLAGKS